MGQAAREVSVCVRVAVPEEYDAVGQLTVECYLADGLVAPASDYLPVLGDAAGRARDTDLLVATLDGRLAGTVTYVRHGSSMAELAGPEDAEIRMLGVHPAARGHGVGSALVDECLRRAREAGLASVVLSTDPAMAAARRIYLSRGFTRWPERDWSPVPDEPLLAYRLLL